jgi:CRP-like cAMP-binding protein
VIGTPGSSRGGGEGDGRERAATRGPTPADFRTTIARPYNATSMAEAAPDALRRSRIFDGLSAAERERWLDEAKVVALERGRVLARQGDPATSLYLVETGFLKLIQLTAEGAELIVRFVSAGEPFGGVVMLDTAAYPVTALAAEPTRLRAWPRDRVRALLETSPQVQVNIMREMTAHMTDALTRVRELSTARVGQRLAYTLVRLGRQCGRETPEGILIAHPLTRQELAELTGTTLFTVSRTLKKWETSGLLRSDRQKLLVRSPKRLLQLAGEGDD